MHLNWAINIFKIINRGPIEVVLEINVYNYNKTLYE